MIFFFIFVLFLSIYEIYNIAKNEKDKKATLVIIYISIATLTILAGIYYYLNKYGNSIGYYIIEFLNINN